MSKTDESEKIPPLELKIGSQEEAFWTNVKRDTELQIQKLKNQIKFAEGLLEMATAKAEKEKTEQKDKAKTSGVS